MIANITNIINFNIHNHPKLIYIGLAMENLTPYKLYEVKMNTRLSMVDLFVSTDIDKMSIIPSRYFCTIEQYRDYKINEVLNG